MQHIEVKKSKYSVKQFNLPVSSVYATVYLRNINDVLLLLSKRKIFMRTIIQRVSHASVMINGAVKSSIGVGLLILLGIEETDTIEDIRWLSAKISRLRIFSDENQLMNLSVLDVGGSVLVVSQFTLHASTKKGNRPSFIKAARPETAVPLYESFLGQISADTGKAVMSGVFGADMKVELINDGPVTIIIDSKNRE